MFWWGRKKLLLINFAQEIADELYGRVPPEIVEKHLSGKSQKSTRRFDVAVEKTIGRIAEFNASEAPGVYGKAKLHQVFAEHLKELGYPADLVDELNNFILTKTP